MPSDGVDERNPAFFEIKLGVQGLPCYKLGWEGQAWLASMRPRKASLALQHYSRKASLALLHH